MVMESAQRVIAVSLGKIASSRTQRGGARLHRSLLVAGVLMNARSATDPCHSELDSDDLDAATDADLVETCDEEATACLDALTPLLPPSPAASRLGADDRLPTVVVETSLDDLSDTAEQTASEHVHKHDCSNRLSDSGDAVVETNRKRKRHSAEADETVESVEIKRFRCEPCNASSESSLTVAQPAMVADSLTDARDDDVMEVDSIQLSSLVHCFSSGFQGLLSTTSSTDSQSPYAYALDAVSDARHHMSASESIISCSIQIREALETLSRPVLALSV